VLVEIGNALASLNRNDAVLFIERCYRTANVRVVLITTELLLEATRLYRLRPDKQWELTDCRSFIVMASNGLTVALTSDHHFPQAGFRALLLEEP
jgi:predicted nucleic acid-binding protein